MDTLIVDTYGNIEYHADDYGLFFAQSQEILDCFQNGTLNAISIIPNSPNLAECMDKLHLYQKGLKVAIHLNFIEGCSLCSHTQVNLLTNNQGIFCCSFGKLLLVGISLKRNEYCQQLQEEIRAQIHTAQQYLKQESLCALMDMPIGICFLLFLTV